MRSRRGWWWRNGRAGRWRWCHHGGLGCRRRWRGRRRGRCNGLRRSRGRGRLRGCLGCWCRRGRCGRWDRGNCHRFRRRSGRRNRCRLGYSRALFRLWRRHWHRLGYSRALLRRRRGRCRCSRRRNGCRPGRRRAGQCRWRRGDRRIDRQAGARCLIWWRHDRGRTRGHRSRGRRSCHPAHPAQALGQAGRLAQLVQHAQINGHAVAAQRLTRIIGLRALRGGGPGHHRQGDARKQGKTKGAITARQGFGESFQHVGVHRHGRNVAYHCCETVSGRESRSQHSARSAHATTSANHRPQKSPARGQGGPAMPSAHHPFQDVICSEMAQMRAVARILTCPPRPAFRARAYAASH